MEMDLDEWFMSEILPLRPMLLRYLHLRWRSEDDLPDLVQETLTRVYEAARAERPMAPRPFVFMIARNLMIDKVRRTQVVSIDRLADFEWSNLADDTPSPEQYAAAREELNLLRDALNALPPTCRDVVVLRKVEGLSQRETAHRLGFSEETVEHLVAKGMRLLKKAVYGTRRPLIDGARRYIALRTSKT